MAHALVGDTWAWEGRIGVISARGALCRVLVLVLVPVLVIPPSLFDRLLTTINILVRILRSAEEKTVNFEQLPVRSRKQNVKICLASMCRVYARTLCTCACTRVRAKTLRICVCTRLCYKQALHCVCAHARAHMLKA